MQFYLNKLLKIIYYIYTKKNCKTLGDTAPRPTITPSLIILVIGYLTMGWAPNRTGSHVNLNWRIKSPYSHWSYHVRATTSMLPKCKNV